MTAWYRRLHAAALMMSLCGLCVAGLAAASARAADTIVVGSVGSASANLWPVTVGDLKGKIVSVGGAKDITRIFFERMLVPSGVDPKDVDLIFAGATSARLQALQSGAADAAILTAPYNFHAEAAGFTNLGRTADVLDMPFSGVSTNRNWARSHKDALQKFLKVYTRSIAWLAEPANRNEAVELMMA